MGMKILFSLLLCLRSLRDLMQKKKKKSSCQKYEGKGNVGEIRCVSDKGTKER